MASLSTIPDASALLASSSNSNILTILSPALTHSLYLASVFQRLLSTTTLFVAFRAYFLSAMILRQSFYASQILLMQSYFASALLAKQFFLTSKQAMNLSWKATERLRNKLFFEFIVFILGGGNSMFLVIFWPGWIVIGAGACGVWWTYG